MKTDELIMMLSTGAGAVVPAAPSRRYAIAVGWGAFGVTLGMAIFLGVRADIAAAMLLPMFWVKTAFAAALFATALLAALRLSRPGVELRRVPVALAGIMAAMAALAGAVLLGARPDERLALVFGNTWASCLISVPLLSVPAFAALLWAMKGCAPTRPALAGAAAGLCAGALAATIYALHCPELGAPFIAVWYALGMLIPAAVGAALGLRMLRW